MRAPQFLILLPPVMLMQVAAGFPADRRAIPSKDKQASWDDVNVVALGLLQLGQGLKEHVDKTKAQMRDVNAKLQALNGSAAALERRQQERDGALGAAEDVRLKVEEVKTQNQDIHSRMDRLEEKVDQVLTEPMLDSRQSDQRGISFIQRTVAAQNRRIDGLVEKIRQQQDRLEKQSLQLQTLQSKVAHKRVKSHRRRDEEMAQRGVAEQSNATSAFARDCHDLFLQGQRASGVYKVQPQNSEPFDVLCQMSSEGGWTVIQKRLDGSQSFNHLWESYKRGFGSLDGNFWLGLESIHSISQQGQYLLQVELSDWAGQKQVSRYGFQLEGEKMKFALHLEQGSSSGARGEIIRTPGGSGLPFSTADSDNDLAADVNCAELLSGGWWFSGCGASNLNGKYPRKPRRRPRGQGMFWTAADGQTNSLRTALLKIAPVTIKQSKDLRAADR